MFDQHRRCQTSRLTPFEDGDGDVGGEISQTKDLAVVGSVQLLAFCQIGKPEGALEDDLVAMCNGDVAARLLRLPHLEFEPLRDVVKGCR